VVQRQGRAWPTAEGQAQRNARTETARDREKNKPSYDTLRETRNQL